MNKVHRNVKPFACDEEGCQFTALNKSILKSHVRNVHCNVRNFPCAQGLNSIVLSGLVEE